MTELLRTGTRPAQNSAQTQDPLVAAAMMLEEAENLRQAKKLQRSKQVCEQLLEEYPDYVGALHTLGFILADMKEYEKSASYLSKATMLCPRDWRILTGLSSVNLKLKRADAAIENLEQAQKIKPDDPSIIGTLAEIYRNQKEYELAADLYEKFIQKEPELYKAKFSLGDCYEHLGDVEKAVELYESMIKEGQSARVATVHLAQLPINLTSIDVLSLLQKLEDSPEINESTLRFAQALNLHNAGKYEEAWEQLIKANEPKKHLLAEVWRSSLPRRDQILKFARNIPLFKIIPEPPKGQPVSLFILGPSRAGKTTLERLLSIVPSVKRGYENPIVENAVRRTTQISGCITLSGINGMPSNLDKEFLRFYSEELIQRAGGARVFTNTHPAKIVEVLRYAKAIPAVRFIFIKRNPEDLIMRTYMKSYESGNSYAYDIKTIKENMDWYYALSEIYSEKLPGISQIVYYEDMLKNPAAVLDAAGKLCGIDVKADALPNIGNDQGIGGPYRKLIREALG